MMKFILPLIVVGLATMSHTHVEKKEIQRPNIILCMADDQGWGDMGYMGHPIIQTPNFDAMAAEALRFDRFYAAAPVCSPTRGSVLTGRHPNRFGCFLWGRTLRPQEVTIAELLKKAGYATGHFGKWHLGSVRMGSPVNPGASGFDEWFSAPNYFDNDPILCRKGMAIQTEGESSVVTVEAALEFIRKQEGTGKPYFAVIWFGSPHGPHQAVEKDRVLYDTQPEELQHFYGEVTGMDRAFGQLRTAIKELDSYENTILWYCSDNGGLPEVGTTGGRGHKGQIYEGGLRVPALMEWPAIIKKSKTTYEPAITSDIFPTLLDIAGIESDPKIPLDGFSLLPLVQGASSIRTKPIGFWSYPARGVGIPSAKWMSELLDAQNNGNMVGDSARLRMDASKIPTYPADSLPGHAALLEWPWKLHRIQDDSGGLSFELYNLANDSLEEVNLAEQRTDRVISMKGALENWQKSVVSSLNGKDY